MSRRKDNRGRYVLLLLLLCISVGCSGAERTKEKGTEAEGERTEGIIELESKAAGLRFQFPEGWIIKNVQDQPQGEETTKNAIVDEFAAQEEAGGSGIVLSCDHLGRIPGAELIRIQDHAVAFRENMKLSGEYSCAEIETVTLWGEEYYTFWVKTKADQLRHHFYLRRIDDRVILLTVTVAGDDRLETLLGYISEMEAQESEWSAMPE